MGEAFGQYFSAIARVTIATGKDVSASEIAKKLVDKLRNEIRVL